MHHKELAGIVALEIQLPCQFVEIPDIPLVSMPAIGALLHFNHGDYSLPPYSTTLVNQLITVDFLEQIDF